MTGTSSSSGNGNGKASVIDRHTRFGYDVVVVIVLVVGVYFGLRLELSENEKDADAFQLETIRALEDIEQRIEQGVIDRYTLTRAAEVRLRQQLANPGAVVIDPRTMEPLAPIGE